MENIKELLDGEIASAIENLTLLKPGSEEYSAAVESIAKLYKLRIDETEHEHERQQKVNQLDEQVKDRYFRVGLEAAGIILPLAFYAFWMRKGFKFEETGTFTSTTFRGLFNRFRPTNK